MNTEEVYKMVQEAGIDLDYCSSMREWVRTYTKDAKRVVIGAPNKDSKDIITSTIFDEKSELVTLSFSKSCYVKDRKQ